MSEESCCRLYTVYTVYLNVFAASCFACYKPKIIYLFFCLIMDFKQTRNQPLAVMCLKMILIKKIRQYWWEVYSLQYPRAAMLLQIL